MKKKFIYLITILISILIILILPIFFVKVNLPKLQNSTEIYDENGYFLGEVIKNNIRHKDIKINDIPEFIKNSIIKIEDKNFYKNSGIDFLAIFRAFLNNLDKNNNTQGASTISMQIIRNIDGINSRRTYFKKIKEFYSALKLNFSYSKDEILEYYLNSIYFGNLNYGINTASKYYFGKEINNLTKAEQIGLLTIIKNPNLYSPLKNKKNFENRFKIITNYLTENKIISQKEYKEIINEKLSFNDKKVENLPYIVDYLESKNIKDKFYSSINYELTKKIDEIAKNTIIPLKWKGVGDYSILIVDRNKNQIKVLIGGEEYKKENGQVNSVFALRQPGSAIKPFTYTLAFKYLGLSPESKIIDEPVQFFTKEGYAYNPKNYSLDYKGEISLAEALSQSINIPAVKLADKIGVENLLNFLKKVGFTSLNKEPDFYGLALTLGVGEVNLYELLRGYTIFANNGNLCDFSIEKEKNGTCKNLIEPEFTDKIEEILTNRYFKLRGFPINSSLDFEDKYVFVKTGTSRNFKDNWSIGFTKNYMIGVWAGNKNGEEMKGVSGATGAGEIFRSIVYEIEKENFENKIVKLKNDKINNFLEITSPLNGSIYKIDKSKPENIQKIKLDFKTNIQFDKYFWEINGKKTEINNFSLKKGNFDIKINLIKDGKNINLFQSKIKVIE